MFKLMILVWQNREGTGEPDVEVKIPTSMAKWVPRLMKFVPKETKETKETKEKTWGHEVDLDGVLGDLENLVKEATETGQPELMRVKTKDAFVKITVEE